MNLIDTHFKKEEDFEIDLNPNILQCYNFYPDLAFFCKFMVEKQVINY